MVTPFRPPFITGQGFFFFAVNLSTCYCVSVVLHTRQHCMTWSSHHKLLKSFFKRMQLIKLKQHLHWRNTQNQPWMTPTSASACLRVPCPVEERPIQQEEEDRESAGTGHREVLPSCHHQVFVPYCTFYVPCMCQFVSHLGYSALCGVRSIFNQNCNGKCIKSRRSLLRTGRSWWRVAGSCRYRRQWGHPRCWWHHRTRTWWSTRQSTTMWTRSRTGRIPTGWH